MTDSKGLLIERDRILAFIKTSVEANGYKGALIGISGGIDSAVVGKLVVDALGKNRVFALLLPERDSARNTIADAISVCRFLGIAYKIKPITPLLRKLGVYRTQPPAFLFPRKIQERYVKSTWLKTENPYLADLKNLGGNETKKHQAYYRSKHRVRMVRLYFEAEKLGYAVVGTTNKTETLTGFYIKWGDDSADIEPIQHLYKSRVFELARELGIPSKIIEKPPSPDLAPGMTDEFAMGITYEVLDRILEKIEMGSSLEEENPGDVRKTREILEAAKVRDIRNLHL